MLGNTGRTTSTFFMSATDDLRLIVIRDIIATVILTQRDEQDLPRSAIVSYSQQFELCGDVLNAWWGSSDHDTQNEGNRKDNATRYVSRNKVVQHE